MNKQIFEGITVLDFTSNAAGPTAVGLMADHGADIIKIERPITGDECRNFGPKVGEGSLCHCWCNRGKQSVTVDLSDPEGIAFVKSMILEADVMVESNRPGVMDRLGLGYDVVSAIKPDIIYCSISAFGQKGPLADQPGYDLIAQAMSGIMHITGEKNGPPMKSGLAIGDFFAGMNGYSAIVTALYHKLKTGEGQFVDVSLLQGLIWLNTGLDRLNVGEDLGRNGNHHPTLSPYGLYQGKNGQSIIIAAVTQAMWYSICDIIGQSQLREDPRFGNLQLRSENQEISIGLIENWLKTFENIEDALTLLKGVNIPCCKVYSPKEAAKDPQVIANGWLVECETADDVEGMDTYTARGPSATWSKTPATIKKAETLGQSNEKVMKRFGFSQQETKRLQTKWAKK